jgi:predicted ATPase
VIPLAGPAPDALRSFVRDRQVLLVLDNCEHVAGSVAVLCEALRPEPDCVVLVTSREPIGIDGETIWTLRPLDLPGPEIPDATSSPAVQLFLARARDADPALRVGAGDADVIARICAGLDGLPLAIELAAARVRAYSLEEIAEQVAGDPAALTPVSQIRGRRQSLGNAIDSSYRLLTGPEQELYRRLAVLPGPFTQAAAIAIADHAAAGPGVVDVLPMLVNRSLLASARSARPHGPSQFSQLVTVRAHAARVLAETGSTAACLDRRDEWVHGLCGRAPRLGRVEMAGWHQMIEDDYPTVRAMLQRSLVDGCHPPGARVAAQLMMFWYYREQLVEALRWLRLGVEVCDRLTAGDAVRSRLAYASILTHNGRPDLARPYLDRALADLGRVPPDDLPAVGDLLVSTAVSASAVEEYAMGGVLADRAAVLAGQAGDPDLRIAVAAVGCLLDAPRADPARTAAQAEQVYAQATEHGHLLAAWLCSITRSLIAVRTGRPQDGIIWSERLVALVIELGARRGNTIVELSGIIHALLGEHYVALQLLAAARAHARRAAVPWPRRPVVTDLLAAARHALTREEFDQAWRTGEQLTLAGVLGLLRDQR